MANMPEYSELGKKTLYVDRYNPDQLYPVARKLKRDELGLNSHLPFYGFDFWNHYEVSWLNEKGKPIVALAEISYGCESINIIESKSMKLYFNSFNNTQFNSIKQLEELISKDISERIHAATSVKIIPLDEITNDTLVANFEGKCLDALDIACSVYQTDPSFLSTANEIVSETLYSNLLKSNCLVTNQPDWCSIQIKYQGRKINHAGLLRYIVSFRNSNEFHEQCIEKIFMHIMQYCQPESLTIHGRSTRRGGIDINSYRSTEKNPALNVNMRLCRQ